MDITSNAKIELAQKHAKERIMDAKLKEAVDEKRFRMLMEYNCE